MQKLNLCRYLDFQNSLATDIIGTKNSLIKERWPKQAIFLILYNKLKNRNSKLPCYLKNYKSRLGTFDVILAGKKIEVCQ